MTARATPAVDARSRGTAGRAITSQELVPRPDGVQAGHEARGAWWGAAGRVDAHVDGAAARAFGLAARAVP
jgi:hypothetical protein